MRYGELRFKKRTAYFDDAPRTHHILQVYGEIEQAPNSTDGEGNPIYDGPTIEGWYDVPVVDEFASDAAGEPHV
jgi:hypothetical protein